MEEDTAKLHHATVDGKKVSLINFNRSGVPLVEIVTEPDIHSPEQAKECLKAIRDLIRSLGVSDCDMEKGSMRLEANISLSPDGSLPNYKVEVKNINSFRYFSNALTSETKRQTEILSSGKVPVQETRGYRSSTNSTVSQRSKEEAADYRYFPEPDIPPFHISSAWLAQIRARLPELPTQKISALLSLGVSASAAKIIVRNSAMYDFLSQITALSKDLVPQVAKDLVNKRLDFSSTTPGKYLKALSVKKSSLISSEAELTSLLEEIIAGNPSVVADYRKGKINALGYFVGALMKQTSGKADPKVATALLTRLLQE